MKLPYSLALVSAFTVGCKGKDAAKETAGSAASPTEVAASGSAAPAPPPSTDPAVVGPNQGIDLAAIKAKLQGTWLMGPEKVPHILSIDGDTVVEVDTKGVRHDAKLELIAPCYMGIARSDGETNFWTFTFAGESLYAGLGGAAIPRGAPVIGCVSAGVFVLKGTTCTGWRLDRPARAGDKRWTPDAGTCSIEGSTFVTDATLGHDPRPGVSKLNSMVADAYMNDQMGANLGGKAESLDQALAVQKAALEAK